MGSIYDFSARTLDGQERALAAYRGKAMVIVNVASHCGFTPQYKGLEALYRKYHARGLEVLGFPCNQFGKQEPDDAREIANFCSTTYDVTFPMFAKIDVNGAGAHPLYRHLEREKRGLLGTMSIKWNFTKFLVGRDGAVIARYGPATAPETLEADIERALG